MSSHKKAASRNETGISYKQSFIDDQDHWDMNKYDPKLQTYQVSIRNYDSYNTAGSVEEKVFISNQNVERGPIKMVKTRTRNKSNA